MMRTLIVFTAAILYLAIPSAATASIVPGQVDDFEDGTLQGWLTGSVNQNPPVNIATGGPGGVDDNFLRLTSIGGFGPGSKMVVFNEDQWTGDYLGAGVSSVRMQVNNLGANDLVLRLILKDDAHGQSLTTLSPVNVPSGSGWTTVSFPLNSANLAGGIFDTVIHSVTELSLVHGPNIITVRSQSPPIAAQLGLDNITAVTAGVPVHTWNVNSDGNWSTATNWTVGVPNSPGVIALLGDVITAPRTVTVDVPVRVGRLDFENANTYTVAGTNTLTLDATSGDAQINVSLGQHAMNAPVTLADNTTIKIAPQASRLTLGGALNAAGKRLTKTGAGTLALHPLHAAELSIDEGSVAVSTQNASDATVIGILSIAGGATPSATLDLTNSAAVIDYTGASPAATVRAQILSGRGGSGLGKGWNGLGINSSAAAQANATSPESRSIAYAENSAMPLGALTTFHGQAVDSTSVLIALTRTGDANLDGVVNDNDVTIVGANYAPGIPKPAWALGDFDYNGIVDDNDVTLLGAFYNPSAPPLSPVPPIMATTVSAVPEPGTLPLLAIAAIVACRWLLPFAKRSSVG